MCGALDKAGIDNLTRLWRLMGVQRHDLGARHVAYASRGWPHRLWLDGDGPPAGTELAAWLTRFGPRLGRYILPVWGEHDTPLEHALRERGMSVSFRQTAMVLTLPDEPPTALPDAPIKPITNEKDVAIWAGVASEAFGYVVPAGVIRGIAHTPGLSLYLAYRDGRAVGTGLLFDSDGVSGIHMLGVVPAYRHRGLARALMHTLMLQARRGGSRNVTLQASDLGESLYAGLGFERRFGIRNYAVV